MTFICHFDTVLALLKLSAGFFSLLDCARYATFQDKEGIQDKGVYHDKEARTGVYSKKPLPVHLRVGGSEPAFDNWGQHTQLVARRERHRQETLQDARNDAPLAATAQQEAMRWQQPSP